MTLAIMILVFLFSSGESNIDNSSFSRFRHGHVKIFMGSIGFEFD